MLEYRSLSILPWAAAKDSEGGKTGGVGALREILDPDTGACLGFAWRRRPPGPHWLRWLARPALEVHERDDESLLFTLYRPWFHLRAWEVLDAEEHLVGTMRKNFVLDRFGRVLARAALTADASGLKFLAPDGSEVASLAPAATGNLLTFDTALAGNPFAKMLVLASALALTNQPARKT